MHWHRLILPALAILAGALALPRGTPDLAPIGPQSLARRLEVARLRAHFDSVDAELRHAQAAQPAASRRTARATLIGWLQEYRDAGEFPRNDRFPLATPFFRDAQGVLCAMAYLIDRSGRRDLVDRVASTRNNAFIAELADDPELRVWLDSVGLSVTEAARIQPSYGPGGPGTEADQGVTAGYAVPSILISGASLTTLGLNLASPGKTSGWAGLIAGSVGVIAGAANLDGTDGNRKVAAANMIIGSGAIAAGLYRLLNSPSARPVDEPPPQSAGSNVRLAISPLVVPTSAGPRFGIAMRSNF